MPSSNTFQAFAYILSISISLAKANHVAKSKVKGLGSVSLQKWREQRVFAV